MHPAVDPLQVHISNMHQVNLHGQWRLQSILAEEWNSCRMLTVFFIINQFDPFVVSVCGTWLCCITWSWLYQNYSKWLYFCITNWNFNCIPEYKQRARYFNIAWNSRCSGYINKHQFLPCHYRLVDIILHMISPTSLLVIPQHLPPILPHLNDHLVYPSGYSCYC